MAAAVSQSKGGMGARLLRQAASAAVMLLIMTSTTELLFRWVRPTPRAQVVRDGVERVAIDVVDGVPFWDFEGDPEGLANEGCERRGDGLEVLIVGDSVLYTWFEGPERELLQVGATLGRLVEAVRPGSCVRNTARAGFTGAQERLALDRAIQTHPPDVVFWEVWKGDGRWTQIGDGWVDLGPYVAGADGLPQLPVGPPAWVSTWLAHRSHAWRYILIALGTQSEASFDTAPEAFPALVEAEARVRAMGGHFVAVVPTPLHRPLKETVADPLPSARMVFSWAEERGVPMVSLAKALEDEDYLDIRLDPSCHFNAKGHELLGRALFGAVDWTSVPAQGSR